MSSWLIAVLLAAVFGGAAVVLYRRSGRGMPADDRPWWRRVWDGLLEAFSAEPPAAAIPEPASFPGARTGKPEDAAAPDLPPPPPAPRPVNGAGEEGSLGYGLPDSKPRRLAGAGDGHGGVDEGLTGAPTVPSMGGSQSDLLHGITSLVNRAASGDIRDVRKCLKTLATAADCLGAGVSHLGRRLAEPDKHYGSEIWEPCGTAGSQIRSGALHLGQSDAMVASLQRTTVGELANSPRRAPHASQLNGPV